MSEFAIFTDSGCDIVPDVLNGWGVGYRNLTFKFDGDEREYENEDMPVREFYKRMREGGISKTSAVNVEKFVTAFKKALDEGKDVLYIGFSSGLSTTSTSGIMAANELQKDYPDRKIIAIDTLCASAGEGLVVDLALRKKNAGASIDETAEYVRKVSPSISHWFTVEDLKYLKRGGRITAGAYFAATVLDIKPVMRVDEEGKLVPYSKVRGRKKSIEAILSRYEDLAVDKGGLFYVGHGDCEEEAQLIADTIKKKYGAEGHLTSIGPVIGSHSGPGTIVLCFEAKSRI